METLTFEYNATRTIHQRSHVGVVGSGDLEVLLEPSSNGQAQITIRTGSEGFGDAWKAVLDRFFLVNDIAAKVTINDFGATPGVVNLRLAQALEVSQDVPNHQK
ncbi:malonate decarboxylase subunit delta [Fictibacillus nanhaiensis]|uniref:malonate decarboxylase subunit delta n=1 Tax=Fictibacillus nanhaiensis TaxID=742169 RepID=UPI00203B62A1|nr:malonate decarboxylase subunit delta [Fictibacillus nanhaiensis]MCM3732701.1 malonate decarboxylase subunit delta [Fictibacillus nanhaiensis]